MVFPVFWVTLEMVSPAVHDLMHPGRKLNSYRMGKYSGFMETRGKQKSQSVKCKGPPAPRLAWRCPTPVEGDAWDSSPRGGQVLSRISKQWMRTSTCAERHCLHALGMGGVLCIQKLYSSDSGENSALFRSRDK
jgi:hypothetical protein